MLANLIDTSNWTYEQWLAAIILCFCVITVIVFIHRIYKVFRFARRPAYKPNLRPLRRTRHRPIATAKETRVDEDSGEGSLDDS